MSDVDTSQNNNDEEKEYGFIDFSELVTSANHKRYLQLVHTGSMSDDDGDNDYEHITNNGEALTFIYICLVHSFHYLLVNIDSVDDDAVVRL